MKRILLLFLSITIFSFFICSITSCEKDPEIVNNTIIQTDTVFVNVTDTVYLTDTLNLSTVITDTLTTFILVRHAEDQDVGTNPDLSSEGIARTEILKETLSNVDLNAVYSTSFNRTLQTAGPVAMAQNLPIENYNPFNLHVLVDEVLEHHLSEIVLIVGHSDTTPALLNILVGENIYEQIPDTEFNNLFIVSVAAKGEAQVVQLKYGD